MAAVKKRIIRSVNINDINRLRTSVARQMLECRRLLSLLRLGGAGRGYRHVFRWAVQIERTRDEKGKFEIGKLRRDGQFAVGDRMRSQSADPL